MKTIVKTISWGLVWLIIRIAIAVIGLIMLIKDLFIYLKTKIKALLL